MYTWAGFRFVRRIDVDELVLCSKGLSDISRLSFEDRSGGAVAVETEDGWEGVVHIGSNCVGHDE